MFEHGILQMFVVLALRACIHAEFHTASVSRYHLMLDEVFLFIQALMILCYFPNTRLDLLLASIRNGETPAVDLKAILTPQNCFWTFSQLYQELLEEHLSLFSNQE